ncbi:MAG: Asp-tRNA(Asn)/Glu-tRNA(Gln) amidotransferase subunit GatA [Patescibacteria group bacterium]
MIDLENLTIEKARKFLDAKEFSAVDLANAYLAEIEKKNKELNAYLEVFDDVLDQARVADEIIAKGESYPLLGIPLAIKDNILIKGQIASSASKMLENYVASYDATVITKLKKQGAVFLGRTNMDDSAMGGSTENSAFGVTKNPHDLSRVAGGSSGGSVATVIANLALGALGSDTGGSVREPAAFCGIVGMKPTYGRVSRYGLIAMGSSLDCIGPIAKNVEDAQIIYEAILGSDVFDSTTITDTTYKKLSFKKELTLGVPWDLVNGEGINEEVKENFKQSIDKLEKFGFKIKDISIKNIDMALAVYYIIMPAEASTNLSRFDGMRYGFHKGGKNLLEDYKQARGFGFGQEVRRRILLGTYVLSAGYYDAYYGKAQMIRNMLKKEFSKAFENVDLIATPTAPFIAWKIGAKSNPLSMYLADIFTITANIIGVPAMSIPSGFSEIENKKLPLGIQFMAPHGREDLLFEVGKQFETLKKE